MINWKDRKYVNPRKRVFKNMDTDEILNLEIQDDLDNIEEESTTPLNAHNLNMAQQDLLDDMSKTYTGTNITAPTVKGYGTIHKLYGHTIEEGTGEKSPSNPYTLKCVADDVNLFDRNLHIELDGKYRHASNGQQINNTSVYGLKIPVNPNTDYILNADITNDNITNLCFFDKDMKYLSGNSYNGTDKKLTTPTNCVYITSAISKNFTKLKLQKGSVATPYSPYNQGTLEIISQNGDQQSSNIVVTKPLCCLRDSEGNIVAQDWIDYSRGVVHRECTYVVIDGSDDEIYTYVANNSNNNYTQINLNLKVLAKGESRMICSHFKYYSGATGADKAQAGATIHNSNILVFSIPKTIALNVETFKAWLSSNPITLIYQLATPTTEPLDCSNKIVQYADETTVSNRDNAEIEVSLTNNKAISEVNRELGGLRDKTVTVDLISEITSDFGISTNRSQFKKVNDMYNLNLFIGSNTVFGNDITIANIPTKHTPNNIEFLQFPVMLQNLNSQVIGIGRASIKPNGQISLHHDVSNVYRIVLSATYIK